MKAINGLLLQYEQTLKAELEKRKADYNHDTWVHLAALFVINTFVCWKQTC